MAIGASPFIFQDSWCCGQGGEMQFVNDPVKSKRVFILMLVLTILFFLAAGGLGYLYYTKYTDYKNLNSDYKILNSDKQKLEDQLKTATEDLQKQIQTLTNEKSDLTKQLEEKNKDLAKITAYKEFLKYMNYVIEIHNGYSGWTDTEYATARNKAQATGDSSFVSLVDWAWNQTSVAPETRILAVLKAIVTGIESSL